jgi:hypothetical protein
MRPVFVAVNSVVPSVPHDVPQDRNSSFFLGAFAKLREDILNFVLSVCPYVRME